MEIEAVEHGSRLATTAAHAEAYGYRFVNADRIYTVSEDDPHFHTFDRVSTIEITRPGVAGFETWYQWSGLGRESDPVVLSEGHTISQPVQRHHNWKRFFVSFIKEPKVGELVHIHTRQHLYDDREEYETYLSLPISPTRPWQSGLLRVRLPSYLIPREENIDFFTYPSHDDPSVEPIAREPGRIAGPARELIWAPPAPLHVGWRYEIAWRYDHEGGIYGPRVA